MTQGNDDAAVPERWNAVGAGSGMWMDTSLDPRFSASAELEGERATLLDYLRGYRLTMEMKCADLDAGQLASRSVPPSTMSLLGLIRHMAEVERNWFRRVMAQADAPPLYWSEDVADADWLGAVADPAVVDGAWRATARLRSPCASRSCVGSPTSCASALLQPGTCAAVFTTLPQ